MATNGFGMRYKLISRPRMIVLRRNAIGGEKPPPNGGTHSADNETRIAAKSISNPVKPLTKSGSQMARRTIDNGQQRHLFTVAFKSRRDFVSEVAALAVA